jgi:hypothetical protein
MTDTQIIDAIESGTIRMTDVCRSILYGFWEWYDWTGYTGEMIGGHHGWRRAANLRECLERLAETAKHRPEHAK